jgi:phage-related minor tail protein
MLPLIGKFFTVLIPALFKGILAIGAFIIGSVPALIGAILIFLGLLAFRFREEIGEFFTETFPEWRRGATESIKEFFSSLVQGLRDRVGQWREDVIGWFRERLDAVKKFFDDLQGDHENLGSAIVSNIISGVGNKLSDWRDGVVNWFDDRVQAVKDFFDDLSGDFENIGSAIVDGIIKGIKSTGRALGGAVRDVANSAVDAAKKALGIESPSLVFAEIGDNVMEGMKVGIDRSTMGAIGALQSAAVDMSDVGFDSPTVPITGRQADGGDTFIINVTGGMMDPEGVAREVVRVINDSQRRAGAGASNLLV